MIYGAPRRYFNSSMFSRSLMTQSFPSLGKGLSRAASLVLGVATLFILALLTRQTFLLNSWTWLTFHMEASLATLEVIPFVRAYLIKMQHFKFVLLVNFVPLKVRDAECICFWSNFFKRYNETRSPIEFELHYQRVHYTRNDKSKVES